MCVGVVCSEGVWEVGSSLFGVVALRGDGASVVLCLVPPSKLVAALVAIRGDANVESRHWFLGSSVPRSSYTLVERADQCLAH